MSKNAPSVPNPMAAAEAEPSSASAPPIASAADGKPVAENAKPAAAATPSSSASSAKATTPQQQALQQQIQAQLQAQLQSQLQAAAARGKQANITPEMIQAQAQAMVQAAAQAQAVVAAAKNRGGGLVPMNAAQIAALSQIQAQAIVNARPQTALIGSAGKTGADDKPTQQQIQNQIQLQAQALVHAHTQAQISAGIYKGGEGAAATAAAAKPKAAQPAPAAQKPPPQSIAQPTRPAPVSASVSNPIPAANAKMPPQQLKQPPRVQQMPVQPATSHLKPNPLKRAPPVASSTQPQTKINPALTRPITTAVPGPIQMSTATPAISSAIPTVQQTIYNPGILPSPDIDGEEGGGILLPPTSPEFLAKMNESLTEFWAAQLQEMHVLGNDKVQTEQDFKNHNDLPLARIKRIMKSDEDVRMISAEAPVLFAKACEMFILEMTTRSWMYSNNNKRKTLTKEDVKEAIQRTDIFDFLVDVIH